MQSLLLLLLDRRSGLHSDPPQTKATPRPSPSTIMTLLSTCRSTPSPSPQSQSTPPRSVNRSPSAAFWLTAIHTHLSHQHPALAPGRLPAALSTTAPHTGCCPTATALRPCMPTAPGPSVWCTLSQSHVTLYYRSPHMKSLCELRHGERLF